MNNNKQAGITFKMFIEARGELRGKQTIDYQAMNEKQLRQYLEIRREHGEKPTHKISLEEVEAIYQSKLASAGNTLKTLRTLSC